MLTVQYTASATRELAKLPLVVQRRITAKLDKHAQGHGGVTRKLKGEKNLRLRVGDYRVIFEETSTTITVVAVGHRRDVYR